MTEIVHATSPGKVILFGEHVVLYNIPAICFSLDAKTRAVVKGPASHPSLTMHLPKGDTSSILDTNSILDLVNLTNTHTLEISPELRKAASAIGGPNFGRVVSVFALMLAAIHKQYGLPLEVEYSGSTDLPVGAGLGSSASLSSSMACALLVLAGRLKPGPLFGKADPEEGLSQEQLQEINRYAYYGETFMHVTASGVDNTVTTFGGAISYLKGKEPFKYRKLPELKLIVVDSGVSRETARMVAGVKYAQGLHFNVLRQFSESSPEAFAALLKEFLAIHEEVHSSIQNYSENDFLTLQEMEDVVMGGMKNASRLLNKIGVGHTVIDRILQIAQQNGLSGKLTGAGGGGCAIILVPHGVDPWPCTEALKGAGYKTKIATIGGCSTEASLVYIP